MCGYVLFTEPARERLKRQRDLQSRSEPRMEKIQGLWEKEMEDPEDRHLECKGLAYVRKLITLPEAKAIKSRKQELRVTRFCFSKWK